MLLSLFSRKKKKAPVSAANVPTMSRRIGSAEPVTAAEKATRSVGRAGPATPAVEPIAAAPVPAAPNPAAPAPVPASPAPVSAAAVPVSSITALAAAPATAATPHTPAKPPTVPELRAQAKALGLTGYSRLPKAELLRVIAEHNAT